MRKNARSAVSILTGLAFFSIPVATPRAAPADACRDLLAALPAGSTDPVPFLAAAACLRRSDSLPVPAGASRPQAPEGSASAERSGPRPADSLLASRLPGDKSWFLTHLERYRTRRDAPRALGMAYLAEAKALPEAAIYRELSAVYLMVPDPYRAGLALLRVAELDSTQGGYLQYQLENLLHQAGSEVPAAILLDSLTAGFRHRQIRTAELLESLSWSNRNYPAAYRNFLARMALRDPGPAAVLERAGRFHSLGYFDHADALLEKTGWRGFAQPWRSQARALFLRICFQLQDWPAALAETSAGEASPALSDEENFIVATALLRLGRPGEALARLKSAEKESRPPWGFRGRILMAQAQTALGKPEEAARTLAAVKRDPNRREGTGPILFWQGCLALERERFAAAESLMVLASAYTGAEESQRALEYRFYLLLDTGEARSHFFRGLPESPHGPSERRRSLDKVDAKSGLWPFAQLEKAQMFLQNGHPDSAAAVFDAVGKGSADRFAAYHAEAKAAFMAEKLPGGRRSALARYEDLLIKYQQGVIPEFLRGRIKALR